MTDVRNSSVARKVRSLRLALNGRSGGTEPVVAMYTFAKSGNTDLQVIIGTRPPNSCAQTPASDKQHLAQAKGALCQEDQLFPIGKDRNYPNFLSGEQIDSVLEHRGEQAAILGYETSYRRTQPPAREAN